VTGYVGNADFHDGHIISVVFVPGRADVKVRGFTCRHYLVSFNDVISIESESPEGMMLYALREEATGETGARRFIFVNWHDAPDPASEAYLRIVARSLAIQELN
jgi:hypothetical protein